MANERVILHIDFDSFFASVEQQYNQKLRGRPIGVTATNGRTCIIAASKEAKRYGIKTGSRTFDAIEKCPGIIFVPADFVKYLEISKKFLSICNDYSPTVELFSIDEVFIDITMTSCLFGGPYGIVHKMKTRLAAEIGQYITASFGISHNKLLAKLASGLEKPNGVVEIKKEDIENVYKRAQLTDMCGIGPRVAARLHKIGIYTLLQLRSVPILPLIIEFGTVEGRFLKNIGLGIDESAVIPYSIAPEVKSVGRNYCLPHNEYNQRIILQNMYELCEEVGLKLRRLKKKVRSIGISLRGSSNIHGRHTYATYTDSGADIFSACLIILRQHLFYCHPERSEGSPAKLYSASWDSESASWRTQNDKVKYVRQISVWVGALENSSNVPVSLFDTEKKKSKLQETIDRINERFGDHTIRNGFLLYSDKLTTVPNGYMADTYERTKLAEIEVYI